MAKEEDINRKCIVSGEVKEKHELLRFTLAPDHAVIPDFNKKLAGKGVYVCNKKTALSKAIEKNLFAKALKVKARVDIKLADMAEAILRKKGLESINLARKAGILITGFEKVAEAIKKNKVAFILEANDAGEDGHQKILAAAKGIEVFGVYTTEELDKALDKINTVHAAFEKSEMAEKVRNDLERFRSFVEN